MSLGVFSFFHPTSCISISSAHQLRTIISHHTHPLCAIVILPLSLPFPLHDVYGAILVSGCINWPRTSLCPYSSNVHKYPLPIFLFRRCRCGEDPNCTYVSASPLFP